MKAHFFLDTVRGLFYIMFMDTNMDLDEILPYPPPLDRRDRIYGHSDTVSDMDLGELVSRFEIRPDDSFLPGYIYVVANSGSCAQQMTKEQFFAYRK